DAFDLASGKRLADRSDAFGGHAGHHAAGRHYGALRHHGARGDHTAGADHGLVHHNGTHADEHLVLHRATMHNGVMPDADIVPDGEPALLVGAVQGGIVLDVHAVADADAVYIAAHHGVVPHAASVAHHHIADHHGRLGQEGVTPECRREPSKGTDQGHGSLGMCRSVCGYTRCSLVLLRRQAAAFVLAAIGQGLACLRVRRYVVRHVAQVRYGLPQFVRVRAVRAVVHVDDVGIHVHAHFLHALHIQHLALDGGYAHVAYRIGADVQ